MPAHSSFRPDLLIAGASARAAAFSAVRAGLTVAAADLFADRDLAAVADVAVVEDWPEDIERWAERFAGSIPLMYTGGLENHPDLLARLSEDRKLAGILGAPLQTIRTPERLASLLAKQGVPVAEVASKAPQQGRWLVKPRHSGGGRGIRFFDGGPIADREYLQEFVSGTPGSAAFLAIDRDTVELLGVCESLPPTTEAMREAMPFGYFGSMTRDTYNAAAIERVGCALASIDLRGLFGVDFVCNADDQYVVVEVNPRYTASMELHELRSRRSLVAEQLATFGLRCSKETVVRYEGSDREKQFFGKRIVYAPCRLVADLMEVASHETIMRGEHSLADVPAPNASISAMTPVCTVLAHAATAHLCAAELEQREEAVLRACSPAE